METTKAIYWYSEIYNALVPFLDGHPEQVEFVGAKTLYFPESHEVVLRITCQPKGFRGSPGSAPIKTIDIQTRAAEPLGLMNLPERRSDNPADEKRLLELAVTIASKDL